MADPQGFLKYDRSLPGKRPVVQRIRDYHELYLDTDESSTVQQAARCMDCGIPFCHSGCPLGNIIPEFNDAVYQQNWKVAYDILSSTNNFPEFTGRICPAPCESACVLGINQSPVAIEHIEKHIAEVAFERGYAQAQQPQQRTGKSVAIVGSGPAGLAAADQLNKAGHTVTVYERNTRIGGLLRYGIPDFKLEKRVIDRRLQLMQAAGINFRTNAHVGINVDAQQLLDTHDALLLCGGSTVPRDIPQPGRHLRGIHYAMEFLEQNNKRVAGDDLSDQDSLLATDKHVIVIGGGDTGADCVGTSNRHRAASVTQIELLDKPGSERDPWTWPNWPMILRTSTSHEEGCEREWALLTKAFVGDATGAIRAIETVGVTWDLQPNGRYGFVEVSGSEQEWPCDLLLIAAGFVRPETDGVLAQLGIALTPQQHVAASEQDYRTNLPKVFAAGDMRRGQSLVVWAIAEGREAARRVDAFLSEGQTVLAGRDASDIRVAQPSGLV